MWLFRRQLLRYPVAMRCLTALGLTILLSAPATAGATSWVDLGPGTRLRLISSDKLSVDGTTLVAIELDMPADTKTYWRVPGEGGILTGLDTAGSTGIAGHRFIWPYPTIEEQGGLTDFVYHGPTVLPIELKLEGGEAVFVGSVLLGICSDICIPASAQFTLPLSFARVDVAQEIRIAQAIASAPIPWDGATDAVGEPVFDAAADVLRIRVDEARIEPASLIADAARWGHLLGAPQKSPEPRIVELPLLAAEDGAEIVGKPIQIIFMTRDGPYEVSRTVRASTPGAS